MMDRWKLWELMQEVFEEMKEILEKVGIKGINQDFEKIVRKLVIIGEM